MKKLLIGVLLLPLNAVAQETPPKIYWAQKPVQCASMEEVIGLVKKYGEIPTITMNGKVGAPDGNISSSKFILSLNKETKTWTLLEFINEEPACILGSGVGNISFGKREITT